jgi:hypothetical protein
VSLSLRDELRVVLSRDQLQLVRLGWDLSFKGKSSRVLDKKSFPLTEAEGSSWESACQILTRELSGLPAKSAFANVILSNHFMRYAMVPGRQVISNEAEELAYAKHRLVQLYGASAEFWEIRLNHDSAADSQLVSAVDAQLLQALREVFSKANVLLKSVKPQLMAAYNNCKHTLQKQNAWFVLYEEGSLCLGLVQYGEWRSVRTIKVGRDWLERLPEILDREVYLNEFEMTSSEIFLWAPEYWRAELPKSVKWKVHKLQPVITTSIATSYDERFAIAMCG